MTSTSVYIADTYNHRVQMFDITGTFVGSFGEYGTGDGQFIRPHCVSIHDGVIYVTDTRNNRVHTFAYNTPSGLAKVGDKVIITITAGNSETRLTTNGT